MFWGNTPIRFGCFTEDIENEFIAFIKLNILKLIDGLITSCLLNITEYDYDWVWEDNYVYWKAIEPE